MQQIGVVNDLLKREVLALQLILYRAYVKKVFVCLAVVKMKADEVHWIFHLSHRNNYLSLLQNKNILLDFTQGIHKGNLLSVFIQNAFSVNKLSKIIFLANALDLNKENQMRKIIFVYSVQRNDFNFNHFLFLVFACIKFLNSLLKILIVTPSSCLSNQIVFNEHEKFFLY